MVPYVETMDLFGSDDESVECPTTAQYTKLFRRPAAATPKEKEDYCEITVEEYAAEENEKQIRHSFEK